MFSVFTIHHSQVDKIRELIVRSEDIREIEDTPEGYARVLYVIEGEVHSQMVVGTARANLERLRTEELQALEQVQRVQQRQASGLPALPVPRGRSHA